MMESQNTSTRIQCPLPPSPWRCRRCQSKIIGRQQPPVAPHSRMAAACLKPFFVPYKIRFLCHLEHRKLSFCYIGAANKNQTSQYGSYLIFDVLDTRCGEHSAQSHFNYQSLATSNGFHSVRYAATHHLFLQIILFLSVGIMVTSGPIFSSMNSMYFLQFSGRSS